MNIKTLKTTIEVFYVLLYFTLIIPSILYDRVGTIFSKGDAVSENASTGEYIIIIMGFALIMTFFYGIHYLMKSMSFLATGDYFTEDVTSRFKKTAKLFVITGIGGVILQFISPLVLSSQLKITLDIQLLSFLFLIIMGLFFKFLAQVFEKARALQEENELTV